MLWLEKSLQCKLEGRLGGYERPSQWLQDEEIRSVAGNQTSNGQPLASHIS